MSKEEIQAQPAMPACANCEGMIGELAPGRDPEELCDTCYRDSQTTPITSTEAEATREAVTAKLIEALRKIEALTRPWEHGQGIIAGMQRVGEISRAALADIGEKP